MADIQTETNRQPARQAGRQSDILLQTYLHARIHRCINYTGIDFRQVGRHVRRQGSSGELKRPPHRQRSGETCKETSGGRGKETSGETKQQTKTAITQAERGRHVGRQGSSGKPKRQNGDRAGRLARGRTK